MASKNIRDDDWSDDQVEPILDSRFPEVVIQDETLKAELPEILATAKALAAGRDADIEQMGTATLKQQGTGALTQFLILSTRRLRLRVLYAGFTRGTPNDTMEMFYGSLAIGLIQCTLDKKTKETAVVNEIRRMVAKLGGRDGGVAARDLHINLIQRSPEGMKNTWAAVLVDVHDPVPTSDLQRNALKGLIAAEQLLPVAQQTYLQLGGQGPVVPLMTGSKPVSLAMEVGYLGHDVAEALRREMGRNLGAEQLDELFSLVLHAYASKDPQFEEIRHVMHDLARQAGHAGIKTHKVTSSAANWKSAILIAFA
jgi:hypothetical protein